MNSAPSIEQHGNYIHSMDDQDGRYSEADRRHQMEQRKSWREWTKDLKIFIWNPEKKEVLGRNGKSWALILLFYFVLYAFLTGMFALCIYGLLLTISPYVPTYSDRVFPPGVTVRPLASGLSYAFNSSEKETWLPYTESLHTFLEDYDDAKQIASNVECTPGQYFLQEGEEHEERKACQFRRSLLKNCSGIEDPTFGFSHGKPCILLKMNRVMLSNSEIILNSGQWDITQMNGSSTLRFPGTGQIPVETNLKICQIYRPASDTVINLADFQAACLRLY